MNIVYYTTGITGTGRIVMGISIANALERSGKKCNFTILHSSGLSNILENISNTFIPIEHEDSLDQKNYENSILFNTLKKLKPDLMLFDLLWFPMYDFIDKFTCKKIFLSRQVDKSFFSLRLKEKTLAFNPAHYDKILAIEPFESVITNEQINPIVLKNPEEIFERTEAQKQLGLDPDRKHCLFSLNLKKSESRETWNLYSYLEDEGYSFFHTSLFEEGIFPIVDYLNAFDLVICGAGYNAFWETRYFNKEAIYIPVPTRFENQALRVAHCQDFSFNRNGADELVEIIYGL